MTMDGEVTVVVMGMIAGPEKTGGFQQTERFAGVGCTFWLALSLFQTFLRTGLNWLRSITLKSRGTLSTILVVVVDIVTVFIQLSLKSSIKTYSVTFFASFLSLLLFCFLPHHVP